jgi:hypothetical protein
MPTLDLATIKGLGEKKLAAVRVTVHEWGEGLYAYIGQMSADERDDRLESNWMRRKEQFGRDDNAGFRAFAVAACLCDENRTWLAADEKAINALADSLGDRSAVPISRMFNHACNLNGLTEADVEELEKNLPATPSNDGCGGSQETPTVPAHGN